MSFSNRSAFSAVFSAMTLAMVVPLGKTCQRRPIDDDLNTYQLPEPIMATLCFFAYAPRDPMLRYGMLRRTSGGMCGNRAGGKGLTRTSGRDGANRSKGYLSERMSINCKIFRGLRGLRMLNWSVLRKVRMLELN